MRKQRTALCTRALAVAVLMFAGIPSSAEQGVENFRFGVLRPSSHGGYEMALETTRLPRKVKGSGFRWGVAFDNPSCATIEWDEVVRLPSPPREVTGNYDRNGSSPKTLITKKQQSNQASVVDDFWFDEGDPLGRHRLEVRVNGVVVYAVEFDVVEDR